jgi:hypothetical protein
MLTLETLRVGSLSHQTPQTPMVGLLAGVDFTQFVSLRELSLSYWATGADKEAAGGLLAPGLERFEWVFDGDDGRMVYLEHFGQAEEDFLRELATTAAAREVPLGRIDVVYTPTPGVVNLSRISLATGSDQDMDGLSSEDRLEYPWDRMDKLAGEFGALGIRLAYNRPSVTREEFEATLNWPHSYRKAVAPISALHDATGGFSGI